MFKKVFAILLTCLFLSSGLAMAAEKSTTVKPKEAESGGVVLDSKRYDYSHYEVVTNIEGDWNPFTVEEIDKAMNSFANMIFSMTKIVAQLIDTGLGLLYGLDFLDSWADNISKVAEVIYDNLYQSFAILFFVVAVLQIFFYYMMERNGMKALKATGSLAAVIILAVVWFSNSDYFLKTLNSITNEAQGQVMKAGVTLTDENVEEGKELEGSIAIVRNQYHDLIVRKPYLIMNYGTTIEKDILKNDKNRIDKLLSTTTTKEGYAKRQEIVREDVKQFDNKYMTQSYIPMKIGIALVSLVFSLLLGIPMLLIAFLNAGIQVLIMIIAIVLPISLMVSMLPRFANSGWYTFGRMAGLFFMKVFVGVFILLMFAITTIMYETIPMTTPAHYMLNVVAISMSIILMIKYRDKIVEFITAGQVTTVDGNTINNAYQKVRQGATDAGERATEWALNTVTGGSASAYLEGKRRLDEMNGEEPERAKNDMPLSQNRVSEEQRKANRTEQTSQASNPAEAKSEEVDQPNRTPQQTTQVTGTADGPQEIDSHSANVVDIGSYRESRFKRTPQVESDNDIKEKTESSSPEEHHRVWNEDRIQPSNHKNSSVDRSNRTPQMVEDKPITQWEAQQQINERNHLSESNPNEQQQQRDRARTPQRKVERQESDITSSNVNRKP
ncbi:FUSC family protein [Rossellomorea yichunensis]|uniref:FUSC family protein n=1 Tax=Rossellomorea yichunensis TaxID=3077331 RepID=UPI0028EAA036|nr:FUSC family protein [Rossellomorea sp. YC4-1]